MTRKNKILILLCCLFPWMWAAADPINTTVGSGSICPNDEVVIPVSVSNCNGVAAISLALNFDNTRVNYLGYQNVNSAVSTMLVNQINGTIYMTWANMNAVNMGDGTLLELRFTGLSGNSGNANLNWNTTQCEYSNITGTALQANYYNGLVNVYAVPTITSNPTDSNLAEGQNTYFEVSALGQGLSYQWQIKTFADNTWQDLSNDSHHSNVNNRRLNVNNVALEMDGNQYRCVVSGTCPSPVTSEAGTLTVVTFVPTIVTSLGSVTICAEQVFSVPVNVTNCNNVAAISLILNYNPSLVTYVGYENAHPELANGTMRVNATNGAVYFTWASSNHILQIGDGELISFAFRSASGNSSLTWNTSLCEYSNQVGETLPASYSGSNLTIYFPPSVTSDPTDKTIMEGQSTNFSINASGQGLSYQWQMSQDEGISWETLSNGGHYSNVTTRTLNVNNVVASMDGYRYRCVVNGTCEPSSTSNYATLHVEPLIQTIVTTAGSINTCSQIEFGIPISVTNCNNVGAISLALAYNTNVMTYTGYEGVNPGLSNGQLQVNAANGMVFIAWASIAGANLGDGNLLTLNFTALSGASSMNWNTTYCEYANPQGTPLPTSYVNGNVSVAELSFTITTQPTNQTIIMEENATFTIETSGTTTGYQWQVSQDQGSSWINISAGDHYSNPTTNTLSISNVPLDMNGYYYRCAVSGTCGLQYSSVAILTVQLPPNYYEISLSADPIEGGTIEGAGAFEEGTSCTVTATPAIGYYFINWTENGTEVSQDSAYTFTVEANRELVANFALQEIDIIANIVPEGSGTINGAGTYLYGEHVLLTAIPNMGYVFSSWTENGEVVSNNQSISFTAETNRTLEANFSVLQVNITATPVPASNGIITGAGTFPYGTTVTLVALANEGFQLGTWMENDSVVSTSDTLTFIAETDRNLVANFIIKQLNITAIADPAGSGTINGTGTYNYGDPVVLTATPLGQFEFYNWTENGEEISTQPTISFTAYDHHNLVAHFITTITIAATTDPEESGIIQGAGTYNYAEPVTLTALPNIGFSFVNWTENDTLYSTETSISFTAYENRTFVAHFNPIMHHITVSANNAAAGTVSGGGDYQEGSQATVSAQPNEHYVFVCWKENGATVSSYANYSFTVYGDRNLVAEFSLISFEVTATANPTNGGEITGTGEYYYGDPCTLTATPNQGFFFENWLKNDSIVSTTQTYSFTVTEDATFVANFIEQPALDTTIYAEICYGEVYLENGFEIYYPEVGENQYSITLPSSQNLDSIVNLTLTVYPVYFFVEDTTLCNATSYTWRGNTYTESGIYYDSLQTIHDCDSIFQLSLELFNTPLGEFTYMTPTNNYPFTSLPITFSWDAVSGAEYYDLYVWDTDESMSEEPFALNLRYGNYSTSALQNYHTYNWFVKARNACYEVSSSVKSFYLDITPSLNVNVNHIDFGEVAMNGSTSTTLNVTGIVLEDALDVQITGDDAAMFSFTQASGWNNYNGGILIVTFNPTTPQYVYNASLVISSGIFTEIITLTGAVSDLYVFSTHVAEDVYAMNTPIPISGSVIDWNNAPVADAEVEIGVFVMGMKRTLQAMTNANGQFSAVFEPMPSESGYYTVNSGRVGNHSTAVHDDFNIPGMAVVTSDYILCAVTQDQPKTDSILIRNKSNLPLSNIQLQTLSAPEGCAFSFLPLSLGGLEEDYLVYTVTGSNLTQGNYYEEVRLKATSNEGAEMVITIWYYCMEPRGVLDVLPKALVTTMPKGKSKIVDVMLTNNGTGATGNITIDLPNVEWMSVVGNDTLSSIAVNDTVYFSLRFSPDDEISLVQYYGTIAINSERGDAISLPYTITAVADSTGSFVVDVTDDFTWNTNNRFGPHLANAEVTLTGYYSLETAAHGYTDADGLFQVDDLPEGYYRLHVEAERHTQYDNVILITAGETNSKDIYLQYQAITYSWTVEPTEIPDEYTYELDVEFETNVPVPVVVIDIAPQVPELDYGESFTFNAIITNYGLIAEKGARLLLPVSNEYVFNALYEEIDSLPALTTIVVPITVTRVQSNRYEYPYDPHDPCWFRIGYIGYYVCGNDKQWHYVPSKEVFINRCVLSALADHLPNLPCWWCGPGGGGGGGGGGGSNDTISPPISEKVECHPGDTIGPFPPLLSPNDAKVQDFKDTVVDRNKNRPNSVCSTVKVRFSQNMTMTREAFEGTFTVHNSYDTEPIENIGVDFIIKDEDGNDCTNLFQINTLSLTNLTGIDGYGSLGAGMDGVAQIQFIPTKFAAPTEPKIYYFGGLFSFFDFYTSEEILYELFPVEITVNPCPDLYVDYFMQRDILGDDALTEDVVEPSIPAELGVIIHNQGAGVAKNVILETAEPEIIDNEKGLAIDFAMYGASFNGSPRQLGLMEIHFGNIESGQTAVGEWLFTSSLLGHFVSYEAHVIHNSSYGNPDLSLVSHLDIHELIHPIYAYGNLDDGINDFLVNDDSDAYDQPDSIYFSHGGRTAVGIVDNISFDHYVEPQDTIVILTINPSRIGWNYGVTEDPGRDNYDLVSCTRDFDGLVIPLNNVWQTFVTIPDGGDPVYENKLHIVDTLSNDVQDFTYTLVYSMKNNLLDVLEITGIPESYIDYPLESFTVRFNEAIIDSTFTYEDMTLKCQNGPNLMDSTIVITKVNDSIYDVNITGLTNETGLYVLNVSTLNIKDSRGYYGYKGKQATWVQVIEDYTQTMNFAQGWNWWSTYIEQEGIDGLGMLENSLGESGICIRSQTDGYTNYYADYGWYGSLIGINNESSYRIITSEPCTAAMMGHVAVPSQHPITLSHGWTWMGYVPSMALDVNTALAGLEANAGDKLKSLQGYADYYEDYGWYGSLNTIEPGMGLMYNSTNSEAVTFTYPDNARASMLKANITSENNHWVPNTYAFPTNMTLTAVVEIDNMEIKSDCYELAAFDINGECRGSIRLMNAEPVSRHVAFLTIAGDEPVLLYFSLLDTDSQEEYRAVETLPYEIDAAMGTLNEPVVLHFNSTMGMDNLDSHVELFPNPVDRGKRISIDMNAENHALIQVEILNALGVEMLSATSVQMPASIMAPAIAGIYTLRITMEGKGTIIRKLVVR